MLTDEKLGPLPKTVEQLSGGGGRHLFFKYHPTHTPKTIRKGIDLKTDKGYVLSFLHSTKAANGTRGNAHSILDPDRIAHLPEWVIAEINRRRVPAKASARPQVGVGIPNPGLATKKHLSSDPAGTNSMRGGRSIGPHQEKRQFPLLAPRKSRKSRCAPVG